MKWSEFISKLKSLLNDDEKKVFEEYLSGLKSGRYKLRFDIKPEIKFRDKGTIDYSLILHSWGGGWRRHLPNKIWNLYLKVGDRLRAFRLFANPITFNYVWSSYDGEVESSWFDWEGCIVPSKDVDAKDCKKVRTSKLYKYTEEMPVKVSIVTKGKVDYRVADLNGREIILFKFSSGSLKGEWRLIQEDKNSDVYVFTTREMLELQMEFEYYRDNDGNYHLCIKEDDNWVDYRFKDNLLFMVSAKAIRGIITQPVYPMLIDKGIIIPVESGYIIDGFWIREKYDIKKLEDNTYIFTVSLYPYLTDIKQNI